MNQRVWVEGGCGAPPPLSPMASALVAAIRDGPRRMMSEPPERVDNLVVLKRCIGRCDVALRILHIVVNEQTPLVALIVEHLQGKGGVRVLLCENKSS